MDPIEQFKRVQQEEVKKLARANKVALDKAELERQRAIEQIEEQHKQVEEKQKTEFAKKEAEANERYYQKASGVILTSLKEDSQKLDSRSAFIQLEPRYLERARDILRTLREIGDERVREGILLGASKAETGVAMAIEVLKEQETGVLNIGSYIGSLRGKVFILTPILFGERPKLGSSLDEILVETVLKEQIDKGVAPKLDPKSSAVTPEGNRYIKYEGDATETNGFMLYKCNITSDPSEANTLMTRLIDHLVARQPQGFKEANLRHQIRVVDGEVLDYFSSRQIEGYSIIQQLKTLGRTNISYQEASRITGKKIQSLKRAATLGNLTGTPEEVSVGSLLNYLQSQQIQSTIKQPGQKLRREDPVQPRLTDEQLKQRSYSRLEELRKVSSEVSLREFGYVLGFSDSSSSIKIAQTEEMAPYRRTEGRRVYVTIDGIFAYMERRVLTSGKWLIKE